jgi:[ribosomal protein S5]-alanine N-acetyltransferase
MSKLTIELVEQSHGEELLSFELENRSFFEAMVPPRGDNYYEAGNFKSILKEIVEEQEKGLLYMYIIRNETNELVGRVNLVSVVRGIFNKAELGFRIGQRFNRKGYAVRAVKLVLEDAISKYKLHRIEAGTSLENIGSQIILIKNGFQFTGRYSKYININGIWSDSVNFEKILD